MEVTLYGTGMQVQSSHHHHDYDYDDDDDDDDGGDDLRHRYAELRARGGQRPRPSVPLWWDGARRGDCVTPDRIGTGTTQQ